MMDSGISPGVSQRWRQVKKLLAVRLDSLGDVLMTTPALAAMKETLGCRITLLASPSGAAVTPHIPDIDETVVYEAPWMKSGEVRPDSENDRAMIERLHAADFDAAVIFTVYSQNPLPAALMTYLADVPLRLAHCRENPYHLLTDWIKEPEPEQFVRHEVQRQLDLVESTGCETIDPSLRFAVNFADRQQALSLLSSAGVDPSGRFIVVHPGASAPSRRYPPEGFREIVRTLVGEGIPVVLTGSAEEVARVEKIQREVPGFGSAASLAGQLTVGQLGAVLEMSALLVANNTGPVHMAAAVGTPVVDLYALTNPQHTPWMVPNISLAYDVPCRWCYKSVCPQGHHNCLQRIDPGWVVAAAKTLLMNENPERFYQSVPENVLFRSFPARQPVAMITGAD